jgi:hypothetical protein
MMVELNIPSDRRLFTLANYNSNLCYYLQFAAGQSGPDYKIRRPWKAEMAQAKVNRASASGRYTSHLPYGWLADSARWQRKPTTFDGIEEALQDCAALYRKSLWANADAYVEVWLEKDALAGVVYPITAMYDVPLMVARGYASLSFLHSAAEYWLMPSTLAASGYPSSPCCRSRKSARRSTENSQSKVTSSAGKAALKARASEGWRVR